MYRAVGIGRMDAATVTAPIAGVEMTAANAVFLSTCSELNPSAATAGPSGVCHRSALAPGTCAPASHCDTSNASESDIVQM